MKETKNIKEKLHHLLMVLIPILITQLGMYSMNFFDTTMSGHYSAKDLAGVAIGSSLWVPISMGLTGILIAITPIVAQLIGAKKEKEVSFSVIQGDICSHVLGRHCLYYWFFLLDPHFKYNGA